MSTEKPKVFISYSWTSVDHQNRIKAVAEKLAEVGIHPLMDLWSLEEGQDKYSFMEKMVTDPEVTHVLIFSDAAYAEKANSRTAGVGTESQIISKEVYEKTTQTKFIPIVCERTSDGRPCLPIFLESRKWIDFSTFEASNENFEHLVRAVYGKPLYQNPVLGDPPSYITDAAAPIVPTQGKLQSLQQALMNGKPSINMLRQDFISGVTKYIESLLVPLSSQNPGSAERLIADLSKTLPLRDQILDWLNLELAFPRDQKSDDSIYNFFENILNYKSDDMASRGWVEPNKVLIYELFVYAIAAFMKADRLDIAHRFFKANWLLPESGRSNHPFGTFDEFYGYSEILDHANRRSNPRRLSVLADQFKNRATRSDLTFRDFI
jgi:hypothetical protein